MRAHKYPARLCDLDYEMCFRNCELKLIKPTHTYTTSCFCCCLFEILLWNADNKWMTRNTMNLNCNRRHLAALCTFCMCKNDIYFTIMIIWHWYSFLIPVRFWRNQTTCTKTNGAYRCDDVGALNKRSRWLADINFIDLVFIYENNFNLNIFLMILENFLLGWLFENAIYGIFMAFVSHCQR